MPENYNEHQTNSNARQSEHPIKLEKMVARMRSEQGNRITVDSRPDFITIRLDNKTIFRGPSTVKLVQILLHKNMAGDIFIKIYEFLLDSVKSGVLTGRIRKDFIIWGIIDSEEFEKRCIKYGIELPYGTMLEIPIPRIELKFRSVLS
jgi:hypothetical protein